MKNLQTREGFRDWFLPLGAAVFTLILFLPFASRGIDFHHDGIMLKPAMDVLSGQTLFRDTFTQYGPLTTYLHVLALKISPTLLSLKLITVLAYSIAVFFLVAAWLMFLPKSLTILAYFLFLIFVPFYDSRWIMLPWSSVFALMFQAIAILGLFKCIQGAKPAFWGAVVGVSVALVFWCRQPVGLALSAAVFFLFFVLKGLGWQISTSAKKKIWKSVVISFVLVHFMILLDLMMTGALGSWFYQNLVWPASGGAKNSADAGWLLNVYDYLRPKDGLIIALLFVGLCLPLKFHIQRRTIWLTLTIVYYSLLSIWIGMHYQWVLAVLTFPSGWASGRGGLQFFVPFVVMLGGGILACRMFIRRPKNNEFYLVLALVCVSGASFLQFFPVSDLYHISWSLAPAYGSFVYFIWKGLGQRVGFAVLIIGLVFSPACIQKLNLARTNLSRPLVAIKQPAVLKGMKASRDLAGYIAILDEATQKILARAPDTPITVIGDDALYSTFANNHWNASPYYVDWKGLMTDKELNLKQANIRQRRPIVLFQNRSMFDINEFKQSMHYTTIAEIPFQPISWWFGGQHDQHKTIAESPLRSMVVVAPQELVQDNVSQPSKNTQ
jgi:hypothetical protein